MTATPAEAICADHAKDITAILDRLWEQHGRHRFGVSFNQGARKALRAAIGWVVAEQLRWPNLAAGEAVRELRKEEQSLYYPLFQDAPHVTAVCDRCYRSVRIDKTGLCPHCNADFDI